MFKKLSEFNIGEVGQITNVEGEGKIRKRLFDMGVTNGAVVTLRKKAPLGDPIEVTIRGYELTLRKNEAIAVTLEVLHEAERKSVEAAKKDVEKAKLGWKEAKKSAKARKEGSAEALNEAKYALEDAKENLRTAKAFEKAEKKARRKSK